MYKTFTRTWWIDNDSWPKGLEPCLGKSDYSESEEFETEQEAQSCCHKWNAENDPGRYSLKMEYEEI